MLLAHGERAELADHDNGEYLAVTSLLEGIVIVKKNPDYVKPELFGVSPKKKVEYVKPDNKWW